MGRKKLVSSLGIKSVYSFWLYPIEYQKMKIEYEKLKRKRRQYQTYIEEGDTDETAK